jgi:glycosyltransferase involved in cell wall biosynthesis
MKIALVHDWLTDLGGAERVLIELHRLFPEAPIYTLYSDRTFIAQHLPEARIVSSSLQQIPSALRGKYLAPLMPSAIESFDFSEFDLVISSSVFFAKGLILKPKTKHISYCYSPARQLWDRTHEYEHGPRLMRHLMRVWDRQAADRVDQFIAISDHVRQRIEKYYRREAWVIYPPLVFENDAKPTPPEIKDYYLIVARLYPHKNIEVAIEAFNKLKYPLVVVGDGPLREKLKGMASANIHFTGEVSDEQLAQWYTYCKAVVMPQEEDFGMTSVEAMYFGRPTLALRRGGALETINEGITGEFFDDPIPAALADGIRRMENRYRRYDPVVIKKHADRFSLNRFAAEIKMAIHKAITA